MTADGEYVIPPETVMAIGGGDMTSIMATKSWTTLSSTSAGQQIKELKKLQVIARVMQCDESEEASI
jgi:hypothetical protein